MNQRVREMVDETVREVAEGDISLSDDTVLAGNAGIFDSMQIINLLVALEQKATDEFGKTVSLSNEQLFSNPSSAISVGSLCKTIEEKLQGND